MTVVNPTFTKIRGPSGGIDAVLITWAGLLNGDTGAAVQRPDLADRSIQYEGTFGAGGSGTLEGSNDSVNGSGDGSAAGGHFEALSTPASASAIAITSAGVNQVTEATRWIRPHVTAGDGTTSLTAMVCMRRSMRGG